MWARVLIGFTWACFEDPHIGFTHPHVPTSLIIATRRGQTIVLGAHRYEDLCQFHLGDYDPVLAVQVREVLEELVAEGKIRFYGWSTDDPERARVFAQGTHCVAVQHRLNLFSTYPAAMLALSEEYNLASINRTPLAIGVLAGKYSLGVTFPLDDVRHDYDRAEAAVMFAQLDALHGILTRDGRTLAQGALGWIWGCM